MRRPDDLYRTPIELVEQCMEEILRIPPGYDDDGSNIIMLEPAAGDGRICKEFRRCFEHASIIACDINAGAEREADHLYLGDFLTRSFPYRFDYIITNPPYSLAEEYVRRCISLLTHSGQMILLLRLSFLEGIERYHTLWSTHAPTSIHVLPKRPSFTEDGKTDAAAYAWFEWDKASQGRFPVLDWLPPIAAKDRQVHATR